MRVPKRWSLTVTLCVALVAALRVPGAFAAGPSPGPFFRVEAGHHTGKITRIAVDTAGRVLVTGSSDKTVRVWSLPEGSLLNILRIPIGDDDEGRVNAVALSPDAATVAAGGWTGYEWDRSGSIYLLDRATGRLIRRLVGMPAVIEDLAYSPDGRYLAVTLGGNGIRVYRTSDWQMVRTDRNYADLSHSPHFAADGRLVTTSLDGFVRLYDSEFRLIRKAKAPGGNHPRFARFSPDGTLIAVGFENSTAVNVLSASDLSPQYLPDTSGVIQWDLATVAWSHDGHFLYAAGRYEDASGAFPVRRWEQKGRGAYIDIPASMHTITDLRALPDGGIVYGAADPAFGVIDATGLKQLDRPMVTAHFRNIGQDFRVSSDGFAVHFAFEPSGRQPALFSIHTRKLVLLAGQSPAADGSDGLRPPRIEAPGLAITDWLDTNSPKLNGRALRLEPGEQSRRFAITPDGEHFLLGTDWHLRLFDRPGRQFWKAAIPGTAWGVNVTGNGRLAVAALQDGTIRWYRLRDGQEVLAFFSHRETKEWVLWTPAGFFDASPGGRKLIGYHLNRGADETPEFVNADQLFDLFYRPDLVATALTEDERPIQDAIAKIGDVRQVLAGGPPPLLEIQGSEEVVMLDTSDLTLGVTITDTGGGIGPITYTVNGVVVGAPDGTRGEGPRINGRSVLRQRRFTLAEGKNVIGAKGSNRDATVQAKEATRTYHVADPLRRTPKLYVLAVGVSRYRDHALKLNYAASDAAAFVTELTQGAKGLFAADPEAVLLTEEQATRERIEAAFKELTQKIQVNDVFVLYMAGHGLALDAKDPKFHFIPWEVPYDSEAAVRALSLHQDRLQELLATIKATKSLVILDTCNSGAFTQVASRSLTDKTVIDRFMRRTGRVTLASSSGTDLALEGYKGHGVFTYFLLEGLRGKADAEVQGNRDGAVNVSELAAFVGEHVPRATQACWGYEQIPMHQLQGIFFSVTRSPEPGAPSGTRRYECPERLR